MESNFLPYYYLLGTLTNPPCEVHSYSVLMLIYCLFIKASFFKCYRQLLNIFEYAKRYGSYYWLMISFILQASDGEYSANCTVSISVLDVNNNHPVFENSHYSAQVMEDAHIGNFSNLWYLLSRFDMFRRFVSNCNCKIGKPFSVKSIRT